MFNFSPKALKTFYYLATAGVGVVFSFYSFWPLIMERRTLGQIKQLESAGKYQEARKLLLSPYLENYNFELREIGDDKDQ